MVRCVISKNCVNRAEVRPDKFQSLDVPHTLSSFKSEQDGLEGFPSALEIVRLYYPSLAQGPNFSFPAPVINDPETKHCLNDVVERKNQNVLCSG